jgi:hypothetical protein
MPILLDENRLKHRCCRYIDGQWYVISILEVMNNIMLQAYHPQAKTFLEEQITTHYRPYRFNELVEMLQIRSDNTLAIGKERKPIHTWKDGVLFERSKEIRNHEYIFVAYLEQGYLLVYARSDIETLSEVFDPADVLAEFSNPEGVKTKSNELLERMFLALSVRDSKIVFGGTPIEPFDLWFADEFRRYMMH